MVEIFKLLSISVISTGFGFLGGWLLFVNTNWYYKPKAENVQYIKNFFLIGGSTIGTLTGFGFYYFMKENNTSATDVETINRLEHKIQKTSKKQENLDVVIVNLSRNSNLI